MARDTPPEMEEFAGGVTGALAVLILLAWLWFSRRGGGTVTVRFTSGDDDGGPPPGAAPA